ncbi:MAG: efflux RND transporter periplasmic adaptor subunit [Candidatus Geothermincolia bacterium]
MRPWIVGACLTLLLAAASCGRSTVDPANKEVAPQVGKNSSSEHAEHGGTPAITKPSPPPQGGQEILPGYAAVQMDDSRRQLLGIRSVPVSRTMLKKTIRTVGLVSADETRASEVHVKFEGFIERIFVNYVGQEVQKGQPLFTIYSQDLLAAQQEYLASKAALERLLSAQVTEPNRNAFKGLVAASRRRLELFDVPPGVLEKIDRTGVPERATTIASPRHGTVAEKRAVAGVAVDPMTPLYVIADLGRLWVLADLYERDMALVKPGQNVRLAIDALPGRKLTGKVTFVSPTVGDATRTAKARIEFDNADGLLKPGMYATVQIDVDLGEGIAIPEDAIIDTGERTIVFVAHEGGHFEPRPIEVGIAIAGQVQVLSGLTAGESIAETGQFLLDSESRLRGAAAGGQAPAHQGH